MNTSRRATKKRPAQGAGRCLFSTRVLKRMQMTASALPTTVQGEDPGPCVCLLVFIRPCEPGRGGLLPDVCVCVVPRWEGTVAAAGLAAAAGRGEGRANPVSRLSLRGTPGAE